MWDVVIQKYGGREKAEEYFLNIQLLCKANFIIIVSCKEKGGLKMYFEIVFLRMAMPTLIISRECKSFQKNEEGSLRNFFACLD